jgi:hypothetical protein
MSSAGRATPARAAAPSPVGDYSLCGFRVRSAVPLPEILPWNGDDRAPDITIRCGSAPPLRDPVGQGGPAQVARDGTCRLQFDSIGHFLMVGGREVIVDPVRKLDAPELHAILLGPVLGVLCHQRRLFPLHAACVRMGDGAIALAGRTGAGKSTLAAALARRGHSLVADDICIVESLDSGRALVRPGFPRLKLWNDALQALGISSDGMVRAALGKHKYHFYEPEGFDPSPVALHGIYFLDRSPAARRQEIRPEHGAQAVTAVSKEIYRRPIGFWLGHKVALLTDALRLGTLVPVFRVSVRPDLAQLGRTAERIEAHLLALRAGRPEAARGAGAPR